MSTLEDREHDARQDRIADDQAEREEAEARAEAEWAENRARAEGRPACPTCGRHRYARKLGADVWCTACDEPAVD